MATEEDPFIHVIHDVNLFLRYVFLAHFTGVFVEFLSHQDCCFTINVPYNMYTHCMKGRK